MTSADRTIFSTLLCIRSIVIGAWVGARLMRIRTLLKVDESLEVVRENVSLKEVLSFLRKMSFRIR